tara:strand:- start:1315 stop:1548 length:234 start_codon:yes stop_codon:yes gene_type:complete
LVLAAQVFLEAQSVLLAVILCLMPQLLEQLLDVLLHLVAVAVQEMQMTQEVVALAVAANQVAALEYQAKEMLAVALR